ncbi:MAG: 50S ribosomal protein L21 [Clostridia bacterium]|nr:50S ribosomal protein L21 [Clostridia bacterium]
MYAIIAAGGKQYRVSEGDVIYVEKIDKEEGAALSFDVLMIGGDGETRVGNPTVQGASVEGKLVKQVKGQKIVIGKYKSKKNYDRKTGHRQPYTKVEITSVKA